MRSLKALAFILLASLSRFVARNFAEIGIAVACYFGIWYASRLTPPEVRYVIVCYFIIQLFKTFRGGRVN